MIIQLPFSDDINSPPLAKRFPYVLSVSGIDGLTLGNTAIVTVPTGYTFIVDSLTVRVTAVTGAATTGHISLINSTDTVDLIADTTLTSLTAVSLFTTLRPAAAAPVVAAGKVISFKVGTAYTVATVVTLSADLVGHLI